jgi:hypothetical protein
MNKILSIKCPYGFANQLRLLLAANFLVKEKAIDLAIQEWVINNHNIVDFNKFFKPVPNVLIKNLKEKDVLIRNSSYTYLVKKICSKNNYSIPESVRLSFPDLSLKDNYSNIINDYINKFNIKNCIGVHIRTGCKTALLSISEKRYQPIPHDTIIDILKDSNNFIYLATDNAETQNKFLNIFKNRILFFEKLCDGKESFDGVYKEEKVKRFTSDLSVIADFYILQQCKFFIGSNESTFSLIIKFLRNNYNDYKINGRL